MSKEQPVGVPDFVKAAALEVLRIETKINQVTELVAKRDAIYVLLRAYGWPASPLSKEDQRTKDEVDRAMKDIIAPADAVEDEPDSVDEPPAAKPQDGAPAWPKTSDDRPEGMPSNKDLFVEMLTEQPGIKPSDMLKIVREKWWTNAPGHFVNAAYAFVGTILMRTSSGNFYTVENYPNQRPKLQTKPGVPKPAPPPKPSPAQPAPRTTAPPVSQDLAAFKAFQHNGCRIDLPHRRWRVACALRDVMGKGFVDHATIVAKAFDGEAKPSSPRDWMAGAATDMNPLLEAMGLRIEPYEKLGWFMKEIAQ